MDEFDFSTVKIFHDGTIAGLFLYDAKDSPVGGIACIRLIFDAMEQKPLLIMELPAKDINGNLVVEDGKIAIKEIKVPAAKVLMFDSRVAEFEMINFLSMFGEYRRIVSPETEFADIDNVISRTTRKK